MVVCRQLEATGIKMKNGEWKSDVVVLFLKADGELWITSLKKKEVKSTDDEDADNRGCATVKLK